MDWPLLDQLVGGIHDVVLEAQPLIDCPEVLQPFLGEAEGPVSVGS